MVTVPLYVPNWLMLNFNVPVPAELSVIDTGASSTLPPVFTMPLPKILFVKTLPPVITPGPLIVPVAVALACAGVVLSGVQTVLKPLE